MLHQFPRWQVIGVHKVEGRKTMRLGHVIYVVKDLDAAVKEWYKCYFTHDYDMSKQQFLTQMLLKC